MASALIGALRIVLGMDSAAFEEGLNLAEKKLNAFGKRMSSIGSQLQSTGASLSTYVTLPILGIGTAAIAAAGEAEQASAAVEAALKSMGNGAGFSLEQLEKMAAGLQSLSTFDDDDILSKVTANLLTFGNVQGDVFARAQQSALDLSARLGTDLQGSAVMLGKALNDPINGISALTRVGVSFTAQQKEQIKAMTEAGNVAGAQRLILAELEKQYGGQALAKANTDLGEQAQAWNKIGDALEKVGAVLLPIVAAIAVKIGNLADAFSALSPETQKWIVIAAGAAAALGPLLIALGLMASGIGAVAVALPAMGAAFAALTGPIGLVVAAFAAIAAAWYYWDDIKAKFPVFAQVVETSIAAVKVALTGMWDHWKLVATAVAQIVNGDFSGAFKTVKDIFVNLGDTVLNLADVVLPGAVDSIVAKAQEIWQAFIEMKDKAIEAVTALVNGVQEWMVGKLSAVLAKVKAPIDAVANAFNDLSDYLVGHSVVPDMVTEIGAWMDKLGAEMVAPAEDAANGTAAAFAKVASAAGDTGAAIGDAWSGLRDVNAEAAKTGDTMGEIFSSLGSDIAGLIKGTKDWKDVLADLGGQLLQMGLQGLFGSSSGGIGGFFSSLFGGLLGFASGGSIMPGGSGGIDSQLVAFRKSPNERVDISKPGQMPGGGVQTVHISLDNEMLRAVVTDESGRVVARAAPKIVGTAVNQANKNAPAALGKFQSERSGSDWRIG